MYVQPLYVSTLCVTILCEYSICDHSIFTRYVSTVCVTTLWEYSICEHEHRKVRKFHHKNTKITQKINISSCTGCCRTPKSTKVTTKTRPQFLGRMLQRQKRQKSQSFIVKTPVKSIGEQRKVREWPRKINIEEVEKPKKYENLPTKAV